MRLVGFCSEDVLAMHGPLNVKSCKLLLVRVEVGGNGLRNVSFDVRIRSSELEVFLMVVDNESVLIRNVRFSQRYR